jgi:hypothetical protein
MNNEIFSNTIKNILLADPLSMLGKRQLTAVGFEPNAIDFFADLYVQPNFKVDYGPDWEDNRESDIVGDYKDYRATIDFQANKLIASGFQKSFEISKKGVYVIKGYLGTGKSTYLHWLINEYQFKKKTHSFLLCDFEKADDSTVFLDYEMYLPENSTYPNTLKFCLQLLELISKKLISIENTDVLISEYFDFFHDKENGILDSKEIKEFFNSLKNGNWKEVIYKKFSKMLLDNERREPVKFVKYLIDIIIRLFWYSYNETGKYQIIAVDNLERFIENTPNIPFQDCELSCILKAIKESDEDITRKVNRIKEVRNNYRAFYSIVIATRISTQMPDGSAQYYDQDEICSVDLSCWYDSFEIIRKRSMLFSDELKILEKNPYYTAMKLSLRDQSRYMWGLNGVISAMYNHNYRRIVENFVMCIAIIPEDLIIQFNQTFEIITGKSGNTSEKYLYRMLMLRAMLDYAQRKDYFTKLHTCENPNQGVRTNSFVRLVLSVLSTARSSVELSKLMMEIYQRPYIGSGLNLKPSTYKDLANILYLMNELKNSNINWTNLIVMNYPSNDEYSIERLRDAIEDNAKNSQSSEFNVSLTITPAGELFLQFYPEFEFFACRYASQFPALVSNSNLRRNKSNQFNCITLISLIRNKAENCINHMINEDSQFFSSGYGMGSKGKFRPMYDGSYRWLFAGNTHSQRIMEKHIGYLVRYFLYINKTDMTTLLSDKDKKTLLKELYVEIVKYWEFFVSITKANPGYFKGFIPDRQTYLGKVDEEMQ